MDEEGYSAALTDPAMFLVGLGAFFGIFAGVLWLRIARSIETVGGQAKGPDRSYLLAASLATGAALLFTSVGFFVGRFTGRF